MTTFSAQSPQPWLLAGLILAGASTAPSATSGGAPGVLSYLQAVYPSAHETLAATPLSVLVELFESLDYYYVCEPRRGQRLLPMATCVPIFHASGRLQMPPALPYLPSGIYYSADGPDRTTHSAWKMRASFVRWLAPVLRITKPVIPPIQLHSVIGSRFGPQPSWTNPLAIVRNVFFPEGFDESDVDNAACARPRRLIYGAASSATAENACKASAYTTVAAAPSQSRGAGVASASLRLRELFALRDGDWVEVEQWGGPVQLEDDAPILGTWFNVYKGTGTWVQITEPFVALSKPNAIVRMLRELGRRDAAQGLPGTLSTKRPQAVAVTGLEESYVLAFAKHVGVEHAAAALAARYPDAMLADVVACALYTTGAPGGACLAVDGWSKSQARQLYERSSWMVAARRMLLHPSTCADRLSAAHGAYKAARRLRLSRAFPQQLHEAALNWLLSICGHGAHYNPRLRQWTGWDGQLATLSCALGVRSLVLAAQPNDNGLAHTELVDFNWPATWPALPQNGSRTNERRSCLPPYGRHRTLPTPDELATHWATTGRIGLRSPISDSISANEPRGWMATGKGGRALPCRLYGNLTAAEKGLRWSAPDRVHRCQLPLRTGKSRSKDNLDCYMWCEGAMSQAFSAVSVASVYTPRT